MRSISQTWGEPVAGGIPPHLETAKKFQPRQFKDALKKEQVQECSIYKCERPSTLHRDPTDQIGVLGCPKTRGVKGRAMGGKRAALKSHMGKLKVDPLFQTLTQ